MRRVIAHGGTGSKPEEKDGTDRAVEAGMDALTSTGSVLEAVIAACVVLEDDERFNAGTGSNLRFDGKTIEMDAAVMHSSGRYGAVSAIQKVRNPVKVAYRLMDVPNNIVVGNAATMLARRLGFEEYDPFVPHAREKWQEIIDAVREGAEHRADNEWDLPTLREYWNFETPFEEIFPDVGTMTRKPGTPLGHGSDTIGAVAMDGNEFAAAASTGGTITTLRGRVGDTPNIGAGIFAGERGAIACTGNGDHLLRERVATRIYRWLDEGKSPEEAKDAATKLFPVWVDFCAVIVSPDGWSAGGNRDIAWSMRED